MSAPAEAVRPRERRWGVAALAGAAALLFVIAVFPLLALSLAVLCVALPPRRWVTLVPALAWLGLVLVQVASGEVLVSTLMGWGVVLAAGFAALSRVRPGWSATSRALAALGGSFAGVGFWLTATGGWARLDGGARRELQGFAASWEEQLAARGGDPEVQATVREALGSTVERMVSLLPAGVALQLLFSLALAWWIFVRIGGRESRWPAPAPLREFRFNDQLVWLVIAGVVLVLLPLAPPAPRVGANLLLFMGALYALRGIAIFLYMAAGRGSLLFVLLGALAALLAPPLVLIPLFVGLGDTWLDVRRRIALAAPARE